FVMNIGGVSAIVFFLLKYFVSERERAMLALDEAHKRVRQSLSLAMEVQQNLLPKTDLKIEGLDITGKSIYCDETGGDYYDFLDSGEHEQGKLRVVVGDVSDHGISSALLMATARATIRQRASLPGNISTIVSEVNRQLSYDVEDSGRFMALFFAQIDRQRKSIEWLNAGHTPAVVYDPGSDSFDELSGSRGMPLGIFEEVEYKESQRVVAPGQIIIIATDGIWEAQNPEGERFGKEQIYNIIRQNASSSANNIQNSIFEALNRFQQDVEPEDDMTLVVIKIE
ncbi:MAG: PP2C family protein-serine/threonine phosphatase, partial [Candidatus Thorarchaeota archaeon]